MRLRNIGSNQTVIEIGEGNGMVEVFFSYETPVVVRTASEILVTQEKFSTTTSRHINQFVDGRRHRKVDQYEIEWYLQPKNMAEIEERGDPDRERERQWYRQE